VATGSAPSQAKSPQAAPQDAESESPKQPARTPQLCLPEPFLGLGDAVFLADSVGRILGCNDAVSECGLDAEQLKGGDLRVLWGDPPSSAGDAAIAKVLREGTCEADLTGHHKSGLEWRARLYLLRLRDVDQVAIGILGFLVPVDRSKRDESSGASLPPRTIDGVEFIIASPLMHKFMGLVERVAGHTETALIIGETGTGKELVARTIHRASHRSSQQLVDINCAALPEHLVESELFGYEKGAFSGADASKPGLFELADKSTIFLDEIGELEPQVQVKLLRVLDGAPYYRLGGHRKIQVDVRVVAATNQDLETAVKEGRFRKDLYHRLSQFQLRVPPLRERPEDVTALAEHFLALKTGKMRFSREALVCLQRYDWPGNVRELRSLVAKLALTSADGEISAKDVLRELSPVPLAPSAVVLPVDLEGMEEQMIVRALESTGGRRAEAAARLGISRRTLSRKLREYKIDTPASGRSPSLGTISHDQQKFFRAKVDLPVTLQNSTEEQCLARAQNLSTGGMGLEGVQSPERFAGLLDASFTLPDSDEVIHCKIRLVWADASGRAGARFVAVDPAQFQSLQRWANEQMEREGWDFPV
jgi:transcriptional regulator with PAS, ATPase and Fis domain